MPETEMTREEVGEEGWWGVRRKSNRVRRSGVPSVGGDGAGDRVQSRQGLGADRVAVRTDPDLRMDLRSRPRN